MRNLALLFVLAAIFASASAVVTAEDWEEYITAEGWCLVHSYLTLAQKKTRICVQTNLEVICNY